MRRLFMKLYFILLKLAFLFVSLAVSGCTKHYALAKKQAIARSHYAARGYVYAPPTYTRKELYVPRYAYASKLAPRTAAILAMPRLIYFL